MNKLNLPFKETEDITEAMYFVKNGCVLETVEIVRSYVRSPYLKMKFRGKNINETESVNTDLEIDDLFDVMDQMISLLEVSPIKKGDKTYG